MLLAWTYDRAVGYMNVLGVQGDLPEDGLWEICHIDVALDLRWSLGGRKRQVLLYWSLDLVVLVVCG